MNLKLVDKLFGVGTGLAAFVAPDLATHAFQTALATITAVRLKVEENQLFDVFGGICVRLNGLKSA